MSRCSLLLLCLCLGGCAGRVPYVATPVPSPAPTRALFPEEVLGTSWELDYVLVNGEKQAAYHPGQCLAIGQRPESYYFYDGCNHGYCDTAERRSPSNAGDKSEMCSQTLQLCTESEAAPGATPEPVKWDRPFDDALIRYSLAEMRAGVLWIYPAKDGNRALVFKRMDGPCEARSNYLRP